MLQNLRRGDRASFENILKAFTTHYSVRVVEYKFLYCHQYKQYQTLQQNDCFSLYSLKINQKSQADFFSLKEFAFPSGMYMRKCVQLKDVVDQFFKKVAASCFLWPYCKVINPYIMQGTFISATFISFSYL